MQSRGQIKLGSRIQAFIERAKFRRRLKFLKMAATHLPVGLACKDLADDSRYALWNARFEQMMKIKAKHAIGKTDFELWPGSTAAFFRQYEQIACESKQPVFIDEQTLRHQCEWEEDLIRIWIVPMLDNAGTPVAVIILAEDLSQIRSVESENRVLEKRLMQAASHVPGVIFQFRVDANGQMSIPYVSQRSVDILGLTPKEVRAGFHAWSELIHAEDRLSHDEAMGKALQEKAPWHWEGRLVNRRGELKWIRGSSEPSLESDGAVIWDGILIDVTQEHEAMMIAKAQEATLAEASRLAALSEVVGGVAHEINTPLATILMGADQILSLAQSEYPTSQQRIIELADVLMATSTRLGHLIRNLRRLARDDHQEKMQLMDLDCLIDQTIDLCRESLQQEKIEVRFLKPELNVFVNCRDKELSQVFVHLLSNAIDAASMGPTPWIRIEVERNEKFVTIKIIDGGNGVSESSRIRLFQPFFTTKEPGKGTGLGLSISKSIIEKHGGELWFDANASHTTFVIQLPAAASPFAA